MHISTKDTYSTTTIIKKWILHAVIWKMNKNSDNIALPLCQSLISGGNISGENWFRALCCLLLLVQSVVLPIVCLFRVLCCHCSLDWENSECYVAYCLRDWENYVSDEWMLKSEVKNYSHILLFFWVFPVISLAEVIVLKFSGYNLVITGSVIFIISACVKNK